MRTVAYFYENSIFSDNKKRECASPIGQMRVEFV